MDGFNFKAREEVCEVQALRSSLLTSSSDEPSSSPCTILEIPPESMAMEWTDAKHSLYLKSMEASFVNELYDSMELLGWSSHEKGFHSKSSNQTHPNTLAPSSQFKVLKSGCWRKVHFDRPEPRLVKTNTNDGDRLLSNPWIRHFASSGRNQGGYEPHGPMELVVPSTRESDHSEKKKKKKVVSHWGGSSSKHFRFQRDLLDTDTEASDQNFVDEDKEGEKVKRVKTRKGDSANDQVVPLRKD